MKHILDFTLQTNPYYPEISFYHTDWSPLTIADELDISPKELFEWGYTLTSMRAGEWEDFFVIDEENWEEFKETFNVA